MNKETSIARGIYTPEDADDLRVIIQHYQTLPRDRRLIELGRLQAFTEMAAGIDPMPPRPVAPAMARAAGI